MYLAEGSQEQHTTAQHIFVGYSRDCSGTVHVQYNTDESGFILDGGGNNNSIGYVFLLDGGGGEDEEASPSSGSGGVGGGGSTPLATSGSAPVSSGRAPSPTLRTPPGCSRLAGELAFSFAHPLSSLQRCERAGRGSKTRKSSRSLAAARYVYDRSHVYDRSLAHDRSLAYGDPAPFEAHCGNRGMMHPMFGLENFVALESCL